MMKASLCGISLNRAKDSNIAAGMCAQSSSPCMEEHIKRWRLLSSTLTKLTAVSVTYIIHLHYLLTRDLTYRLKYVRHFIY